jgi:hypothetical protein
MNKTYLGNRGRLLRCLLLLARVALYLSGDICIWGGDGGLGDGVIQNRVAADRSSIPERHDQIGDILSGRNVLDVRHLASGHG